MEFCYTDCSTTFFTFPDHRSRVKKILAGLGVKEIGPADNSIMALEKAEGLSKFFEF